MSTFPLAIGFFYPRQSRGPLLANEKKWECAMVGIRYNKLRKKENTKKKTYLRINLDLLTKVANTSGTTVTPHLYSLERFFW